MKKFFKFIGGIILTLYILIVVVVTICLLGFNDYNTTVLGTYTLIPVSDDALAPDYVDGDLLVVNKKSNDDIHVGDSVFFYEENREENAININLGKVTDTRRITDTETTFTMEGDVQFSSEYVIGSTNYCSVYKNLGKVLSILESRWVFLLVMILPVLFIFLYILYSIIIEVKKTFKEAQE